MMPSIRSLRLLTAIVGCACTLIAPAIAQVSDSYPNRPIRLIVPYAPGGGTDIVMRALAPGMGEALGQTIVVDNKPGGGTILATDIAAKSAPDGYTLLAVGAPIYLNTALGRPLPYDPLKDLAPVSLVVNNAGLLLVNPSLGINSVKDLIALSKTKPQGLNYASAGVGSFAHLIGELMKARTGIVMTHIPYKGSAPALAAVMAGDVELAVDAMIPSAPQVKAGKVKALAILSAHRSPLLPDVPSIVDAGFPTLEGGATFGLMLPAKTPPAIVAKVHAAMVKAINAPATRQQLIGLGYEIVANQPDAFGAWLGEQISTWTKIVNDNNIKAD